MASSSESLPHQDKAHELKTVFVLSHNFKNWIMRESKSRGYIGRGRSTNIKLTLERNHATPNQEQEQVTELISRIKAKINGMDGPVTRGFPSIPAHKKLRGRNANYIISYTSNRVSVIITRL